MNQQYTIIRYFSIVLTFEPSEAEDLLFPKIPENFKLELDFKVIDQLLREDRIDDVLDMTDEVFLRQLMGLNTKQIKKLRSMWKKLSNRRLNRKYVATEETATLQ
jgi:adenine-specific DNA-methyltransferase